MIRRNYKFKAVVKDTEQYRGVRVERWRWVRKGRKGRWILWDSHWCQFDHVSPRIFRRAREIARALNAQWDRA